MPVRAERERRRRRWPARWPAAVLLVPLAGCGSLQAPAESVADRFGAALAASDWSAGCALLAPRTRSLLEQSAGTACPAALAGENLPDAGPAEAFDGFGTMARVRYQRDTVFLTEFRSGWKVMAAGCTPVPGRPYACRLEG
jgi:hypothetical protein